MSGGRSGSPPFRDKRMNHDTGNKVRWIRRVRIWLALFIAGLVSQRCYGVSAEAGIVNDFGDTWRFRSTTRIQPGYVA
jgi:hypothetical protein